MCKSISDYSIEDKKGSWWFEPQSTRLQFGTQNMWVRAEIGLVIGCCSVIYRTGHGFVVKTWYEYQIVIRFAVNLSSPMQRFLFGSIYLWNSFARKIDLFSVHELHKSCYKKNQSKAPLRQIFLKKLTHQGILKVIGFKLGWS